MYFCSGMPFDGLKCMKTKVTFFFGLKMFSLSSLLLGLAFIFCMSLFSNAQVVNGYAKVTGLSGSTMSVSNVNETADTFEDGEKVMLIQMQDNVIGTNTTNANSFGTIAGIGSAGNYEFLTIASHTETAGLPVTITCTSTPVKTYTFTANSSVQIVSLRRLGSPNFSTTSTMSALAWNGDIGGIVAIEVLGTLTLNHSINANNAGFRGGLKSTNNGAGCLNSTFITSSSGYGFKGEGIHKNTNVDFTNARAKLASGGGGGLSHNAGGGGGGNVATGGIGGIGWQCTSSNTGYGIGGQSLFSYYSMNRIFMGGGGGGGQMNNSVATNGGNGGGIVFVTANQIVTPNVCTNPISITAQGQTSANSGNDGSGGAGAAGTIVMQVNSFALSAACPLIISANGGTGGSVGNSGTHGAGGGGGQGAIVFLNAVPTSNYTAQTLNGAAGCNNSLVPCTTFSGVSPEPNNQGVMFLIPLGVTFVEFTAEPLERNVLLTWSTASEENSDYFTIERSVDGENFSVIGQVKAAGSSQSLLEYEFVDVNAFHSQQFYYYRLKEVDMDGEIMYTDLRFVQMDQLKANHIVVFPNPFSEVLNVFIPNNYIAEDTQIFVSDELNRVITSYPVEHETTSLVLIDLAKGMYLISVFTEGKFLQTERVMK
jgi:hypothetical protein